MRFWALIGLADQKEVKALHEKIDELTNANSALLEENREMYKALQSSLDINTKNMIDQLKTIHEQQKEDMQAVKLQLDQLKTDVSSDYEQNRKTQSSVKYVYQESQKRFDTVEKSIMQVNNSLQSDFLPMQTETNNILEQIKNDILSSNENMMTEMKSEHDQVIDKINASDSNMLDALKTIRQIDDRTTTIIDQMGEHHTSEKSDLSDIKQICNSIDKKASISEKIKHDQDGLIESVQDLTRISKLFLVNSVVSDIEKNL